MGQFLCEIYLYKYKCVMDPKTDYSSYYDALASLLFYYLLQLSTYSFTSISCVEDSYIFFCETLALCSKQIVCGI